MTVRVSLSAQCSHKPRWKVFGFAFFKKRTGSRGAEPPKTALFFLRSFFFCASCVKRKSERMRFNVAVNQRTVFALIYFTRHPERSEAESNFFVPDPKRRCAPFAPHCVRSSTTLRMTRTKKRRAKQGGIYEEVTHIVRCTLTLTNFLVSLFLLTQEAQKKKLRKKKTLFFFVAF